MANQGWFLFFSKGEQYGKPPVGIGIYELNDKSLIINDLSPIFSGFKKYFLIKDVYLLFINKYLLFLRHQFKL